MCLYPTLIINKKYTRTKKNGYNAPQMKDERVKYVPIGCGKCIECRKQKAREWQVRLSNEIYNKPQAYFVTLTFSEESIQKLQAELKTKDNNKIATLAVRRFCERWRKKHKKSIRHWLITELGHQNTERLHLHGLLFNETNKEEIKKAWNYGIVDFGTYVNMQTINYIIKYVTKVDNDHKKYIPVILCSPGIGNQYTKNFEFNRHKYKPNNTKDFYLLPNGNKINNPIYYRNKLYTEEEREKLWIERLDKQKIYVMGIEYDISTNEGIQTYLEAQRNARETNKRAGYSGDENPKYEKILRTLNQ